MLDIPETTDVDSPDLLAPELVPLTPRDRQEVVGLLAALIRAHVDSAGALPIGPSPNGKPGSPKTAGGTG